uniref:Uncharacterized protein n=1 Tax=Anopheles merus TaxID=30066 RepID=A0A182VM29_ANOME
MRWRDRSALCHQQGRPSCGQFGERMVRVMIQSSGLIWFGLMALWKQFRAGEADGATAKKQERRLQRCTATVAAVLIMPHFDIPEASGFKADTGLQVQSELASEPFIIRPRLASDSKCLRAATRESCARFALRALGKAARKPSGKSDSATAPVSPECGANLICPSSQVFQHAFCLREMYSRCLAHILHIVAIARKNGCSHRRGRPLLVPPPKASGRGAAKAPARTGAGFSPSIAPTVPGQYRTRSLIRRTMSHEQQQQQQSTFAFVCVGCI